MIERATPDVEAHLPVRTVAAVAAVLGTFAFAQQASAASQPAQSTVQVTAQVSPQVTALVSPQVTAQVKPQAKAQFKAQISKPAQAKWQGVQPQLARSQFASFLSLNRSGL